MAEGLRGGWFGGLVGVFFGDEFTRGGMGSGCWGGVVMQGTGVLVEGAWVGDLRF